MGSYLLRRTFPASRDRVYEFFVDPVAFSHWFVVPGFSTPAERVRIDPRPGGEIHAVMVSDADATQVPFVVGFGDLEPAEKVVLHPGEDERVTITLTDVPEGTELAYRYEGPAAEPADVAAADVMLDRIAEHA
ncbi:SRPBCC domain-containing protein [Micromonospora sp. PSH03]|uniref:SRPBCC family protein n=1 Tax=Micromonospora salmantinae TaxID=2911211 RepID=UPI001EE9A159|nr:SRPBCC domain-containing protein [Micromonospora salmantinae]MCG5458241.1 SRPBCC domain-containing protein [Micromonospora salmantinae]